MLTASKPFIASCLLAASIVASAHEWQQPVATPATPDATRAAFLKLIDRPRVALEPVCDRRLEGFFDSGARDEEREAGEEQREAKGGVLGLWFLEVGF